MTILLDGDPRLFTRMRNQTLLAEAGKDDSAEYRALAKRANLVGAILVLLVLSIEFIMVTKPTL